MRLQLHAFDGERARGRFVCQTAQTPRPSESGATGPRCVATSLYSGADCCIDPRPLGFSTTSIKDSDALSLRRSPDSVGAESPMSPLSTWMWKTVATSTNVTRMRRTTLVGLGRSTTTPSRDKREHANVARVVYRTTKKGRLGVLRASVATRASDMKTPQICFCKNAGGGPVDEVLFVPPDLLLNSGHPHYALLSGHYPLSMQRMPPALKAAADATLLYQKHWLLPTSGGEQKPKVSIAVQCLFTWVAL